VAVLAQVVQVAELQQLAVTVPVRVFRKPQVAQAEQAIHGLTQEIHMAVAVVVPVILTHLIQELLIHQVV
jgi:hypothetical protein